MVSPTERLRIMTRFQKATGLDMGEAIKLLSSRYHAISGWWCDECGVAVADDGLKDHERQAHGRTD